MNQIIKDIILDIARCKEIKEAYENSNHACNKVVAVQKNVVNSIQCPEAFNGHIDQAEFLIVGSNPAYISWESDDVICKRKGIKRFPSQNDNDKYICDFYYNRFLEESGEERKFVSERFLTICEKIAYWSDVEVDKELSLESVKQKYRSKIAFTEIVHCKSNKEEGVSEACNKCVEKYFKRILNLFFANSTKKTIILCGDKVQKLLSNNIEVVQILKEYETRGATIVMSHHQNYHGSDENRIKCIKKSIENKRWLKQ